jgi:tetratricopeptide (TPR) repeat protein
VAAARPEDPRLEQTIFELAVEVSQPDDMNVGRETLVRLTGADSTISKYADACQIVWQVRAKKAPRASLGKARRLLTEAKIGRSEWYEVARLGAEIEELDGKTDDAITGYRRALDLSPGHAATARRLVELLYARGRLSEARDALKLVGQTSPSDLMHKIYIDIERRTGNDDSALAMAQASVDEDPRDAGNRVWLGQLLDAAGRTADAESQFREAVKLQPTSGMAWVLLTHHLMAARKSNAAAELLPAIKRELPANELPQVLAQYYELVGDRDNAEKVYLDALQKNPKNTVEMQGLINFYLRSNQTQRLEKSVDEMIAVCSAGSPDEERDRLCWARRVKAQLLKAQGDFDSLQKAVKVLEANADGGKYSTEDATFLATMLGERPEAESRQKAVKLLEKLQAQGQLPDEMQAQLAQLYERAGRWGKAREQLLNLLGRLGSHSGYMTMLALLQLKHGEIEDATHWIEKVVAAQPNAPQTVELRARLLAKQNHADQAVALIESMIPDPLPPDQLLKLSTAAMILESIEQPEAAEKLLRRLASIEPRAELLLAAFLGRHSDLHEAFALMERSRRSQPLASVIGAGLATMRKRREEISPDQVEQIKRWIAVGMNDDPENPNMRLFEADLFDQTQQVDKVVESYQLALEMSGMRPQQAAIVKNNLAFVLALRNQPGDVEKANRLIDEAIQTLGPSADLQDTRGMVLLSEGKFSDSLRELARCVDEGGSPAKYVHLAIAQEKSGDAGGARRSLNRAKDMGFEVAELSRLERERYDVLVKRLGSR